jgi:hypothetical protein
MEKATYGINDLPFHNGHERMLVRGRLSGSKPGGDLHDVTRTIDWDERS